MDGGGRESPLLLDFCVFEDVDGAGSFDASPDFGGGNSEPRREVDGLFVVAVDWPAVLLLLDEAT